MQPTSASALGSVEGGTPLTVQWNVGWCKAGESLAADAQVVRQRQPASESVMPKMPLFTEAELATAFQWLLPDAVASQAAHEWFEQIADDVDEEGRFVYQDWRELAGLPLDAPSVLAAAPKGVPDAERIQRQLAHFAGMSTSMRLEVLMRFSDFHLNLVSLVSAAAAERIRQGCGLSVEQLQARQLQMRRIVTAMAATRGAA
jgi:hypothetical protein